MTVRAAGDSRPNLRQLLSACIVQCIVHYSTDLGCRQCPQCQSNWRHHYTWHVKFCIHLLVYWPCVWPKYRSFLSRTGHKLFRGIKLFIKQESPHCSSHPVPNLADVSLACGAIFVLDFPYAYLVHQSLSGRTPTYLAADIQLADDRGRQNLRSATDRTCFLPRTHNTFGDRSLFVSGLRVWNSLPADLRLEMQFRAFRRLLKTVLSNR